MIDDLARLKTQLQITKLSIDKPQLYQLLLQMIDGLISVTKSVNTISSSIKTTTTDNSSIIEGPTTTISHADIITWPTTINIPIVTLQLPNIIMPDFVVVHVHSTVAYGNLDTNGYITLSTQDPATYEMGNYIINDGTGFFGTGLSLLLGTGLPATAVLREESDSDPGGWGSIAQVQGNDNQQILYITFVNPAGNLTGGDAGNKIEITPFYSKFLRF